MKKLLAILTLSLLSIGTTFAATGTIEYQDVTGVQGTADSRNYRLGISEKINNNFSGDVSMVTTAKESNGSVSSSRLEGGLTGSASYGLFKPYVRVATGQKFTTTTNFTYYSVEPGVSMPIANTGFTAKLGWRYRNAYDSAANADETKTWRTTLSYAITPRDSVAVRFDRVRGDLNQDIWVMGYSRSF
jgi:hypothetical protein